MEQFTEDERYELEKIVDNHSAILNDTINRYCNTMMSWDGRKVLKCQKLRSKNPLDDAIRELVKAQEYTKKLRDKLERMRKEDVK